MVFNFFTVLGCKCRYGCLIAAVIYATILIVVYSMLSQRYQSLKFYYDRRFHKPNKNFLPIEKVLDENFEACLSSLSEDIQGDIPMPTSYLMHHPPSTVLDEMTDLMLKSKAKLILIEPSILFCMLSQPYKDLLTKRNFTADRFKRFPNTLTFAVMGKNVTEIEQLEKEALLKGHFVKFVKEWHQFKNPPFSVSKTVKHAFIQFNDWVIHLVVFYERGNFLVHDRLNVNPNIRIPRDQLHFVEHPSAYERFCCESLKFKNASLTNIYIPTNPHHFLFQIGTSRLIECNATVVSTFATSQRGRRVQKHPKLTHAQFAKRSSFSLHELKTLFHPLLMDFWLWSGTLLGWYRQCGIIPYTHDVDYAAWASEIERLDDFSERLRHTELKLVKRMGIKEKGLEFHLKFYGLSIDVFLVYFQSNGTWYAGHKPEENYYFKYHHPHFSLCSAEFLRQKVLVPCEPEKVILAEYGPNWMEPVDSWNYLTSTYNRGPNIYWEEKLRNEVYVVA